MPLRYRRAGGAHLRQGEVVGPLWDHQPTSPPVDLGEGAHLDYVSIRHEHMLVMNQDCDLQWDFEARFPDDDARTAFEPELADFDSHGSCVSHVLMCDAFVFDEIRPRFQGKSDIWRRVQQNQDERYHHLDAAPVLEDDGETVVAELPDLFVDFKKTLALPTRQMYVGVRLDGFSRHAVLPAYYLHDLAHRFHAYHSRVAIPEL